MKYTKLFLLAMLLFSCRSDSYDEKSLQRVLNDFDRHSYFVGLTVKSGSSTSPYVIENSDLYSYYEKKDGLTERSYTNHMRSII